MRDPARIEEVIKDIRAAWQNFPEMRLAQLVSCAAHLVSETDDDDPFFMEDNLLQEGLRVLARLEY